jgi:hypothetical protein
MCPLRRNFRNQIKKYEAEQADIKAKKLNEQALVGVRGLRSATAQHMQADGDRSCWLGVIS